MNMQEAQFDDKKSQLSLPIPLMIERTPYRVKTFKGSCSLVHEEKFRTSKGIMNL